MKVKCFKTRLAAATFAFAIVLSACSQGEPAMPDEGADGSRTELDNRDYDARFPVPVWTDEEGIMHLDMDLDNYEAPAKDKLLANLCGHGWGLGKFYKFEVSSDRTFEFYEADAVYDILGGDAHFRYFVGDNSYTHYYVHDIDACGNIVPEEDIHRLEHGTYSYDESTGVLDLHVLKFWHVVSTTENELWLANKCKETVTQLEKISIVKMVRVSDEQVAEWNATFRPL